MLMVLLSFISEKATLALGYEIDDLLEMDYQECIRENK